MKTRCFLGIPLNQILLNPQTLNVYAYANGNLITGKDSDGRQCVNCAGAEVAYTLAAQEAYDQTFGRVVMQYTVEILWRHQYTAARIPGLCCPGPIAAFSAGAGNVTQQGLEFLSGDRTSFDASQVGISASAAYGVQAGLGKLPIPLISASSLTKQISTKLSKGLISNVSDATMRKIITKGAPSDVIGNFATNYAQDRMNYVNNAPASNAIISGAMYGNSSYVYNQTISLAQQAIQLAKQVIAGRK